MSRRLLLLLVAAAALGGAATLFGLHSRASAAGAVAGTSGHEAHAAASNDDTTPRSGVSLDTRRQQLIGVRTARATRAVMAPAIRAAGTVTYDETRQVEVNTRIDGWIRDLYADYTGRAVRRGEPLFTLYSPDLVAEQHEYLLALKGRAGDMGSMSEYSDRLADAARERLLRLDMTADDIDQLARTGRAAETVTFHSPATGIIVEKTALRGMRVTAGQMLYRLADVSSVWVEAEIYETDLAAVRAGMSAKVSLQAYPDRVFPGRVTYIYPTVTEETRTVRVRVVLANPQGLLKPNMLATVELQAPESQALVIPADALVDTGTERLVFVADGDGRFTPREVRVGRRADGNVEVLAGLEEGDEIADSATFFLDSESQLRGALQNYEAPRTSAATAPSAAKRALDVTFRVEPDPPHWGDNTFVVTVKDADGQPITDADVSVTLYMPPMPSMNMPAMKSHTALLPGGGAYRGTGDIPMPGRWDVTVNVTRHGQSLGARQFAVVAR